MKVTVYKLDKKLKPTKEVIGEFNINEITLSERRKLHTLFQKRFIKEIEDENVSISIDEDAFGRFYESVGELSGISDSEFMKYSDDDIDIILMQIYEAWQPNEKKQSASD